MMTNYIGFMVTIIAILGILVVALIWACISIYRINRVEKKIIRDLKYQAICNEFSDRELYLDCQTLLLLLYDIVLSDNVTMEYKSTIVRSSLLLLGMKNNTPYNVGVLRNAIEAPDIDKINDLVTGIVNRVISINPNDGAFTDPKTVTALRRFNNLMDSYCAAVKYNQDLLADAAMDVASDPAYDHIKREIEVELLTQRAQAMMT